MADCTISSYVRNKLCRYSVNESIAKGISSPSIDRLVHLYRSHFRWGVVRKEKGRVPR